MDTARAFADIAAEVEIPDDGTLSRVVYRDDTLRVVVFAFDAGQELTEHTASVPAVIQVLRGRLAITATGISSEFGPGAWIHLPAGDPHTVRATEPSVMLLTLVKG